MYRLDKFTEKSTSKIGIAFLEYQSTLAEEKWKGEGICDCAESNG